MKNLLKSLVLLAAILLVACEEKSSPISLENVEYLTGKIISVDEETFLIESTYFKYPGTIIVPKRNKNEIEFTWQIGDELKVYFDGNFRETDPAQVSSVVSIEPIKSVTESSHESSSASEEETAENPFLAFQGGSSREMEENEVKLLYEVSGGDFEKTVFKGDYDYEVLENSEIQFKFNSKENFLYIGRSDITMKVPNEIGVVVKMALDGTL